MWAYVHLGVFWCMKVQFLHGCMSGGRPVGAAQLSDQGSLLWFLGPADLYQFLIPTRKERCKSNFHQHSTKIPSVMHNIAYLCVR